MSGTAASIVEWIVDAAVRSVTGETRWHLAVDVRSVNAVVISTHVTHWVATEQRASVSSVFTTRVATAATGAKNGISETRWRRRTANVSLIWWSPSWWTTQPCEPGGQWCTFYNKGKLVLFLDSWNKMVVMVMMNNITIELVDDSVTLPVRR